MPRRPRDICILVPDLNPIVGYQIRKIRKDLQPCALHVFASYAEMPN